MAFDMLYLHDPERGGLSSHGFIEYVTVQEKVWWNREGSITGSTEHL